jgi:hypothetical protein
MKLIISIALAIAVVVAGTAGYLLGVHRAIEPKASQVAPNELKLTNSVEAIIGAKMKVLAAMASSQTIIQGVKKSNEENRTLTEALINQRDQSWRHSEGIDNTIKPYLTNAVAQSLVQFQQTHTGFTEIMVTDSKGLNVGLTNKTSDYYQADEAWWQQSLNGGKGKAFHGNIEFDESSQSEAIALYQPIIDSQTHKVIGIMKALYDINAIKAEL